MNPTTGVTALSKPKSALSSLDVSDFSYISVHAPNKYDRTHEKEIVDLLENVANRGWPIEFLAAIKQNVCGKVQRALLPETLEVYPLKGYGAVRDRDTSLPPPRTPRGWRGRRQVCDVVAEQGWRVEGDARDQLQPQPRIVGEVAAHPVVSPGAG
jgi:hypothetical protein